MKAKNRIKLLKYKILKQKLRIRDLKDDAEVAAIQIHELKLKNQRLERILDAAYHFEVLAQEDQETVITVHKQGTTIKTGDVEITQHSLYPEVHGMLLESIVSVSAELDKRHKEKLEAENEI